MLREAGVAVTRGSRARRVAPSADPRVTRWLRDLAGAVP
jgi:hypothetical protein